MVWKENRKKNGVDMLRVKPGMSDTILALLEPFMSLLISVSKTHAHFGQVIPIRDKGLRTFTSISHLLPQFCPPAPFATNYCLTLRRYATGTVRRQGRRVYKQISQCGLFLVPDISPSTVLSSFNLTFLTVSIALNSELCIYLLWCKRKLQHPEGQKRFSSR